MIQFKERSEIVTLSVLFLSVGKSILKRLYCLLKEEIKLKIAEHTLSDFTFRASLLR